MRIKKIEIKDYKAFYGKNEFNVDGKNLFIYGENGSGKSSFYYALKDFFGEKKELTINPNKKNAVFAILTPTIHPDGSGSYCEVAQSDIAPEKLGEHFKIPHYFLVTINFK